MVMALPNQDGSFTIALFFPLKGKNSFFALKQIVMLMTFFQQNFRFSSFNT